MPRRVRVCLVLCIPVAFVLGGWHAQRGMAEQLATSDARLAALGDELASSILEMREWQAGPGAARVSGGAGGEAELVDEIKRQLQHEMGLMPIKLLRERRESFVELNAVDAAGKVGYGTAGYLGNGYFITVKHAVVALDDDGGDGRGRDIISIKLRYKDQDLPAQIVDAGDATAEVHSGDWALIRVKGAIDLPPLRVNASYAYEFADPIFRLGNDYSKGIILSSGYVGQRTANGLVTCLTDGHPGVSGGGVLDQQGDLVGIPIGRMQGDYRFSFILPLRDEMFRKFKPAAPPARRVPAPVSAAVAGEVAQAPAPAPLDAPVAVTLAPSLLRER